MKHIVTALVFLALALVAMASYGAETDPATPLASMSWTQISMDPPTWVRDSQECLLRQEAAPVTVAESSTVIVTSNSQSFTCVDSATSACLLGGRFQVAWNYHLPGAPPEGAWATVQKVSDTSVLLYFQGSTVVQGLVDVLDACSPFAHFWVFAGWLTNVGFDLTVNDSKGTVSKQYIHQPGPPAQAIQDTSAFNSCP